MTTRDLALTFAGGGNRSFYQVGLWNEWGSVLHPRLAAVAACSAGACVATIIFADRIREATEFWHWRRQGTTKNFDIARILRREPPTPHEPIYRDTLEFACGHGGLERIRAQPFPIWILATRFPRRLPKTAAIALGLAAYSLEKRRKPGMLHPTWGKRLGFRPHAVDARTCETPQELAELVLSSSATPPFTPVGVHRGARLLDGGIVDNAPAFLADAAPGVTRNLVLLTRPYPAGSMGKHGARYYLAPTQPVPAERWDYTRPDRVDATVAMGEHEAPFHWPQVEAFLAPAARDST